MSELLPCPFCDGYAGEITDATRVLGVFKLVHWCPVIWPITIECSTREAVIATWNTRALPAVQPDKKLTDEQLSHLPDLVVLALAGFALLKNDKSASEWSHPAIAAFKPLVEEELNARKNEKEHLWQLRYGKDNSHE